MKKTTLNIFVFFLIIMVVLPFFFYKKTQKEDTNIVAKVGNSIISLDDYKKHLSKIYSNFKVNLNIKEKLLNRLIVETLLIQEAKARQIGVNKEDVKKYISRVNNDYTKQEFERILLKEDETYESWLRELKRYILLRKVASNIVSDEIKVNSDVAINYYKAYIRPVDTELVELAQIFSVSKIKIEKAYKALKNNEDFSELARRYSESPEAKFGGYIGTIEKETFPQVFNIAFKLKDKEISKILKSTYGYHIIKVLSHNPKQKKIKELAVNHLMVEKGKNVYKKWLSKKLEDTKIFKNLALLNSME